MANYTSIRSAESQPIGTATPWVGGLSDVPPGWVICNGQTFNAEDYPLLARVIKNAYGGSFSGTFPNYSGDFKIPSVDQKGLADISTEYFTSNITPGPGQQPTLGADTLEALDIVSIFIGPEGDLGTPGVSFATTDLNFSYTPDPEGTIELAQLDPTITSIAPNIPPPGLPLFYTELPTQPNPSQSPASVGTGATFNVIQNDDNTYTIARRSKGQNYQEGDQIRILGTEFAGGSSPLNDVYIVVNKTGNPFFSGVITGDGGGSLQFTPGFDSRPITVFPRKLGRQHFPAHFHTGQFETINKSDSGNLPGRGPIVWDNPEIKVRDYWYEFSSNLNIFTGYVFTGDANRVDTVNIWGDSITGSITTVTSPFLGGSGTYAIGAVSGTLPPRDHRPFTTAQDAHGIGKPWFKDLNKLRDGQDNTSDGGSAEAQDLENIRVTGQFNLLSRLPFSQDTNTVNNINYDLGSASPVGSITYGSDDAVTPYTNTLFNHAGVSFFRDVPETTVVNDVIEAHDHGGSIVISFDNGSLSIPPTITVDQVEPVVTPSNSESCFRIEFDTNSPCLSVLTLIRAY